MGAGVGDPGEYYDMKERRIAMNDVEAGLELDMSEKDSQRPSRVNSADFILEKCGKQRSHLNDEYNEYTYPLAPSPLRFTHLNSPKPDAYFMSSPAMSSSRSFDKRRRRDRWSGKGCPLSASCCCCSIVSALCSVIVTAGILLGFTVLITWLVLRPIHAPRFSVDNVEFRALTVWDSELNADVVYTLTADNGNRRLGFKYDAIVIETSYRGSVFGHSSVPPFSQTPRNITSLTSAFVVENYVFTPASLAKDLSSDVNGGSVAIHARARAVVRLRVVGVTSFALKVFVDCDFLVKPPNGSARSSVINKTCKLTR